MAEVQTAAPELRIVGCTAQHLGDRREQQDRVALLVSERAPHCALAVLADGVGGMSGGALAADSAIAVSRKRFLDFDPEDRTPAEFFVALVAAIHTALRLDAATTGLRPHTTFAAVLLQRDRADWCHVGDSRIHLIRGGRLLHRSDDHSYERWLANSGLAGRPGLAPHRPPNALVNVLGGVRPPQPTLGCDDSPRAGDCFLLCTDGLWNHVSEEELARTVSCQEPREASAELIATARARAMGRGDNCSLALLRLSGQASERRDADAAAAGAPAVPEQHGGPAARAAAVPGAAVPTRAH